MTKQSCHERIERLLTEYHAAGFAARDVLGRLDRGVFMLPSGLDFTQRDLRDCARRLEMTYLLRLFAVFEGTLRTYWVAFRKKATRVPAEVLISSIGANRQIPQTVIAAAHRVRDERNQIVHHDQAELTVGIEECKSRLAKFLSFLPQQW